MSLMQRIVRGAERRSASVVPAHLWRSRFVRATSAGVPVDEERALQITAVLAAVRILAEGVSSLPLILYRRRPDGGKDRATDHPLYTLLHDAPNEEMTAQTFRETLQAHLALWGNAYAQIVRERSGRVLSLWPLRPDRMEIKRAPDGTLWYLYADRPPFRQDEILHLVGLSFDGVRGRSPIALARESLGLTLAAQEFGARFFANDARPGVVLRHPATLDDEAYQRIKASWEAAHQGVENAHRVAILEEGMEVATVGIPPRDAQFLDTRKFQVAEIARIFRVPPHMLADLDRATYSNIEQQSLEFVTHTLRPWLVRWEQAIQLRLLRPRERKEYFAEHLVDGLLRGDIESRYRAYMTARQGGWMSVNDVRVRENMNPIPGGDVYLQPLNMEPVQDIPTRALPIVHETRAQVAANGRQAVMRDHREAIQDALQRLLNREVNDIGNVLKRYAKDGDLDGFLAWLAAFEEEHADFARERLRPVLLSYLRAMARAAAAEVEADPERATKSADAFADDYLDQFGRRWTGRSLDDLQKAAEAAAAQGADAWEALRARLESWRSLRAASEAQYESVRAGSAVAKAVWAAAGIVAVRWVTVDETCPYCQQMSGVRAVIDGFFAQAGEEVGGGADAPPLKLTRPVGHPPLHRGCDCMIVPEV